MHKRSLLDGTRLGVWGMGIKSVFEKRCKDTTKKWHFQIFRSGNVKKSEFFFMLSVTALLLNVQKILRTINLRLNEANECQKVSTNSPRVRALRHSSETHNPRISHSLVCHQLFESKSPSLSAIFFEHLSFCKECFPTFNNHFFILFD